MKTLFLDFLRGLWTDPVKARRWLRAWLAAFATGGLAFADQLAAAVGSPGAVKGIKVAAVLAAFVSLAVTAGEKNKTADQVAAELREAGHLPPAGGSA